MGLTDGRTPATETSSPGSLGADTRSCKRHPSPSPRAPYSMRFFRTCPHPSQTLEFATDRIEPLDATQCDAARIPFRRQVMRRSGGVKTRRIPDEVKVAAMPNEAEP